MKVLMIGNRSDHLRKIARAIRLRRNQMIFIRNGAELTKVDVGNIKVVFIDLLWEFEDHNPANVELAIQQLRNAGYMGIIEGCAINPHGNSYIADLLGESLWDKSPEERELPDLPLERIAEKLAPLLAA